MRTNFRLTNMTLAELIAKLTGDPNFAGSGNLSGYVHIATKDHEYHGIILEKLSPDDLLAKLQSAATGLGSASVSGSVHYGS
jgi:hypothetical protein